MKTCYELFGVECGPGWRGLIEPLVAECQARGVAVLQIKEKFGTLRFYAGGAPEDLYAKIEAAERASAATCEDCGEPGRLRTGGWLRTLCDACEARPA